MAIKKKRPDEVSHVLQIPEIYQPFMKDTKRLIMLYGGAGSGKSYIAQLRILLRIMNTRHKNQKVLCVRKVARTLRNSIYDLFLQIIRENNWQDQFEITSSPLLRIIHKNSGNIIIFTGLDEAEKLKSIAGITSIFIEEATEILEEDFIQLDLRLRGKTIALKQIYMCFNPISMRSWIYKKYFKDKDYKKTNVSIYHSTYRDNPFIDQEYKNQLEALSERNSLYHKVYALGQWASLDDTVVFRDWSTRKLEYVLNKYQIKTVGVDFGYSHFSVALVVAHTEKELHVLREVAYRGLTNFEFIQKIKQQIPEWKELVFWLDSAEPDRIKEFRQQGFTALPVKKGKGSVGFGIDYLLRKPIIVDESCENSIQELSDFKYLKDKVMDVIFPDKFEDDGLYDCIAALRYSQNKMIRQKSSKLKAVSRLL